MKTVYPSQPDERGPILNAQREEKMTSSAHAFVRGSTKNFYESLVRSSMAYGAPSKSTSVGVSPTFTLTVWLLTGAGAAVPLAEPAVSVTVVADEMAPGRASR